MHFLTKLTFASAIAGSLLIGCSTGSQHSFSPKSKTIVLFDGKSTDAFRGFRREVFPDKGWKVEDGTLKTIPRGDVVDLVSKETFENFDLQLEWRISPGGNSGVIYRSTEEFSAPWHTGLEMQILDDAKHKDGKNPKTTAGALYALIAPGDKNLQPVGDWNKARLLVNGNHVEHWLNGVKVVAYELDSPALAALIAESKFKAMPRFAKEKIGHIVLQNHRDEVWFRNITVRKL